MFGRRARVGVVSLLVVVGVVASDLALMPAASAEAPKQVQLEVSAEAPTLDVKAGRKADPSRLAGLSSRVSIPSATPVPVGVEGPTPGTEQPEGWVAPGVRGYEEGRSGEDVKKTSATERVWENPDGTSTLELSSRPVRFRDRAGRWQDFDTDLVAVKGGGFQAKALPEGSNVAAAADAEAVVSAGTEAGIVSLAQPGAEAAQGRVDASGETVTFPDAIDGDSDLVVGLLPNGFETSVVVPDGAPERALFEQVLTVPAGLVARNGSVGVEFVTAEGTVVGSYGSGIASDAGPVEDEVEVRTSLVSQEGTEATVRVSVDPVWLAAPERVFPVTIDPVLSFTQNTGASGAMDTYVQSNIVNTPQSTATELKLGKAYGTSYIRRTLMKFDVSSLVGAGRVVTSANLSVANTYSPSCTGRAITVASLSGSFNASTLWSNQPAVTSPSVNSAAVALGYSSSCPAGVVDIDVAAIVQGWVNGSTNNGIRLSGPESDDLGGKTILSGETWVPPTLVVTVNRLVSANGQPSLPANDARLQSTTPTLTTTAGTDPDGDALRYWFRVTTEPSTHIDASSGGQQVASSGWLGAGVTSWSVPAGILQDGQTYYWSVATWDGVTWPNNFSNSRSMFMDLRLGASERWPTDQMGPVSVNLTNGNLVVQTASPSMPALGGDMAVSYSYDSKVPVNTGLMGSYYPLLDPTAGAASFVRRDLVPSFKWPTKPGVAMPADNFSVVWTGYLRIPTSGYPTGGYRIGGPCDSTGTGAVRYTLNGVAMSGWKACSTPELDQWSESVTLGPGSIVPIKAEFRNQSGLAGFNLKVRGPAITAGTGMDVPADWLLTDAGSAMPKGWTISAELDGAAAYRHATITKTTITVVDTGGVTHRYTRADETKPWAAPSGEYGSIRQNANGTVTLLDDDGQTYVFAASGELSEVRSAIDAKKPSAPIQLYSGTPLRLRAIVDPVTATTSDPTSGRRIRLYYAGDTQCPTTPPSGLAAAVAASKYLCKIDYSDFGAGETLLWYTAAVSSWDQQLARIVDPGDTTSGSKAPPEVTDFAYDTNGQMTKVRDPLAADAVAAGVRSNDDTTMWLISYSAGRVSGVKSPIPNGSEARQEHTYDYTTGTRTYVNATGLGSTTGHLRDVTFDDRGRVTSDADQAGRITKQVWSAQDQLLSSRDVATGLKSTTEYDAQGNAVSQWGPAPAAWWSSVDATGAPTSPNQASTPRTQNRYDEGIETLAATWWSNPDFAGAPAGYSTGINPATNLLYMSWGSGGPAELGGGTQNFSGRITGYILADNTTPYSIRATSFIGTLRIIVDGTVALDETATSSSTVSGSFTAGSAGWKPITIEYSDNSASNAGFGLWWRQNSDPYVRIPGDHTSPGYGLVTSTTDPVGVVSTTSYEDSATDLGPEDGFVTQTVTDFGTGKLNLAETTTYESSAGYRREVSAVRPLGAAATTAKFYYGGTESIDNPCTSLTDPAPQGGQLKMSRDADPAGSGGTGGIEASYIYNDQGRIAASKIGSGGWTCTTYDARGRATMVDVPASGAAVSRVTTTDWAVSNNPLVTSQSDTVDSGTTRTTTTAVDLLGRVRQYEDAWGNVTITSYDQVGRTAQILSPAGTETFSYDANGNPGPTVVDSVTLATPYYDAAGRLSWVQYANGIKSDAVTYDNYGNETSATWRRISDNAVLSTETAAYDLAGRIVELVTDGNNPNPSGPEYTYDRAGRLTSAYTTTRSSGGTISTLHTSYGFGTASGTCGGGTQSAAGKNTNRTSQTVGSTTTTYCYDAADRLVSTSQAGVGTITYDGHGNTTGIWGETRGYDASDRHLTTTKPDGTSVTYQRDATDRIVARTTTGPGGTASQTERYGFTGSSDSPGLTLDGTGTLIETTAGLIGGALRTRRIGGTDVWSLPNLHGDVVATVDNSGATLGVTATYGPYGETNTTLDNSHGNLDYGWLGQHQRPTETQTGLTTTIEMGARQYDPTLGRFLEVDPIEGGSANDYDYVAGDPNNNFDLDGDRCWTGVARRETSRVYNKKKKKWETKTKEICRSVSRGAGRVIRGGARTTRNIGVPALGLAWRILRAKPGPPIMVPCRLVCGMGTRRETA